MSAAPDRAEELFTEHSPRIYAYCLRQLGSREEAEDAVQVTYLNACRSLLQGFEPDVAQAWLFKVAQNVCLSRQRSSWRRRRVEQPEDIQEIEAFIASPHEPGDDLLGIGDALASLSEQQRRAILLREWKGLSYSEVAAEMGLSQAAVETLIFRARRSLAAALEAPESLRPRRSRFAHAFDPSALVASLKAALSSSLSSSVTAGLAVAASATAIATGPSGTFQWLKPAVTGQTSTASVPRASAPAGEPLAPDERDSLSVVPGGSAQRHAAKGEAQRQKHAAGQRKAAGKRDHGEPGKRGHGKTKDGQDGETTRGGHRERGGGNGHSKVGHAKGKSKDAVGDSHGGKD